MLAKGKVQACGKDVHLETAAGKGKDRWQRGMHPRAQRQ